MMIVVDDYKQGKIYAAHERAGLAFLGPAKQKAIDRLEAGKDIVHIETEFNDFVVSRIGERDLFEYMIQRDCTNIITGA